MKPLNLTIIFVAVATVAVVGIAGAVALTLYDKDATAFYAFFTTTLVSVTGFGALARSQGKIGETVEKVQHNVNGRLSQLIDIATQNATTHEQRKTIATISTATGVVPTVEASPIYDNMYKGQ